MKVVLVAEDGAQPNPKGARSAFEHRPQAIEPGKLSHYPSLALS